MFSNLTLRSESVNVRKGGVFSHQSSLSHEKTYLTDLMMSLLTQKQKNEHGNTSADLMGL